MANWDHTLKLGDIFHDDAMLFEQKRDTIVTRIRSAKFYDSQDYDLIVTVDELAETYDVTYFDEVWNMFYDWADAHRVWVETF